MSLVRLLALAAALAAPPTAANACSCMPLDRAAILSRSDLVFDGRIVAVAPRSGTDDAVAVVRVENRIKGRVGRTVRVISDTRPGLCGWPLFPGTVQTFAGRRGPDGAVRVGMCAMAPLNPLGPEGRAP
ncbi:MAG: hypothetical protein ABTQ29_13530 [Siculibacillus sp.]